jgi:hypothetical protein
MSVVDLHPEDLLDKDAQGTLEPSERSRLEAHVAHCSACRLERQLRADFAVELDAELPLERFTGLGSFGQLPIDALPPAPPKSEPRVARSPRRRRRVTAVWLLAAAALLVGGAAAAMNGLGEGPWSRFVVRPALTAPPATGTSEAPRPKVRRASVVELPEPTVAPVVESSAPEPAAPPRVAPPLSAPARVIGPAEMFETASEARRHGDYGRVFDVDRDLERHYPTSREAQVLRAVVGRVLLDRGDPAGGLAKFDSYLAAGGGDLAEEAMVGRATALDRLGRNDEASLAWSALVASFPDTPYAAHAKARLESPSGR